MQQSFSTTRAASTAVPLENFTLNRDIFNDSLYTNLFDLWFDGVPRNATTASYEIIKRWYGGGTAEEKAAFDSDCKRVAGKALDSIGPGNLALPPFISYEDDASKAGILSAPFLQEVKSAQSNSEQKGANVLLALVLLLDQMPRNLFRDQASLPKVYNHFDRISLSLMKSSLNLSPSPVDSSFYAGRPVFSLWYLMPLMHSEDASPHVIYQQKAKEVKQIAEANGDKAAVEMCDHGLNYDDIHLEPIQRFGRFPHRNRCLGRESTPEELEYMKTANTFGVAQDDQVETKDEL